MPSLRQAGAGIVIAAAASPAMAIESRPPISRSAPAAAAADVRHYEIHIHGAGMDLQALGAEVRRQLDERDRQDAARKRSRLGDYED